MKLVTYQYHTHNNVYTIVLHSIVINNTNAYYAEYQFENTSILTTFKDKNEIPYYFSTIEMLKEFLESKLGSI